MSDTKPAGWYAAGPKRLTYWNGSEDVFTTTAREFSRHVTRGTLVAGVDFNAPIHERPIRTAADDRQLYIITGVIGTLIVAFLIFVAVVGVPGMLWFWLVLAGLAWLMWEGRHEYAAQQQRQRSAIERDQAYQTQGIADPDGGPPRCPKCGGTQFKARRTAGDRTKIVTGTVTTGVGGVFSARKHQQKVQCITCGTFYDRLT